MRKGDVWLINLDPTIGAEIKKTRPAVIVSEDAIGVLPQGSGTSYGLERSVCSRSLNGKTRPG